MTIVAQYDEIVHAVVLPVAVDVVNAQNWLSRHRIWLSPSTLGTFMACHFDEVGSKDRT